MLKTLVIADDMTGTNDNGALLNEAGYDAVSAVSKNIDRQFYENRDVLCINTNSRAIDSFSAYQLIKDMVEKYAETETLISKRVDSTLRGNVGSEIDGVLAALPERFKAIVVAAYPKAGRICIGGYILVNSLPLETCGIETDPKTPVTSSFVVEIIGQQSKRSVCQIRLKDVLKGSNHLAEILRNVSESIVVIDAVRDVEIDIIAKACVTSGISYVCVDPGVFTVKSMKYKYPLQPQRIAKNLLVIGSLSEISKNQLDYFVKKNSTVVYKIDIENLIKNYEDEELKALNHIKTIGENYRNLCITSIYSKRFSKYDNLGKKLEFSEKISARIALIAIKILKEMDIGLVYLCGGDIAKDFVDHIHAEGIDVIREVIPLVVFGKLIGGDYAGLNILTKGGMVGEVEALDLIMSRLSY